MRALAASGLRCGLLCSWMGLEGGWSGFLPKRISSVLCLEFYHSMSLLRRRMAQMPSPGQGS